MQNSRIKDIKEIISKILVSKGFTYEIILFGSRARGSFSKYSDYDILVIISKTIDRKEKMELFSILLDELVKNGIDADIIIRSKEEVNYYKNKVGSVVRNALKEGIVL
jgi:predicted nucleotidyltransferase